MFFFLFCLFCFYSFFWKKVFALNPEWVGGEGRGSSWSGRKPRCHWGKWKTILGLICISNSSDFKPAVSETCWFAPDTLPPLLASISVSSPSPFHSVFMIHRSFNPATGLGRSWWLDSIFVSLLSSERLSLSLPHLCPRSSSPVSSVSLGQTPVSICPLLCPAVISAVKMMEGSTQLEETQTQRWMEKI